MWEQWGAWSNVALASLVSDKLIYAMVGWSLVTCIMWGLLHHLHKKEFSWCLIPAGLGRSQSRHRWIYRFTWPSNNGDWWNQWIGGIPSFWTKPSNLMNHLQCFHLKFWEINTVIWNLRYCFFHHFCFMFSGCNDGSIKIWHVTSHRLLWRGMDRILRRRGTDDVDLPLLTP